MICHGPHDQNNERRDCENQKPSWPVPRQTMQQQICVADYDNFGDVITDLFAPLDGFPLH
jgi:hypothetical protein